MRIKELYSQIASRCGEEGGIGHWYIYALCMSISLEDLYLLLSLSTVYRYYQSLQLHTAIYSSQLNSLSLATYHLAASVREDKLTTLIEPHPLYHLLTLGTHVQRGLW